MKRLAILLLAAAGASAAATYAVVTRNHQELLSRQRAELQAGFEREKAALAAQRVGAARPVEVREVTTTVEVPVAVGTDPATLLGRLIQVRGEGDRRRMNRRVVHYLESMVDTGPAAVPVIVAFLRQNQDVEFQARRGQGGGEDGEDQRERPARGPGQGEGGRPGQGGGPGPGGGWGALFGGGGGGPRLQLDFNTPPSLRIGLFDVLRAIGGPEAEAGLVEVLQSTGRGLEIAYLARTLEEMAPGKHTQATLAAAREILADPPALDDPTRLDEAARSYLFDLLARHGDTAFAGTAAQMLVTGEGRVDTAVLRYLTRALGEQSLPALYQAYRDVRVTNLAERAALMQNALPFVGGNALANAMFAETLNSDAVAPGLRAMMVQGLVYGNQFGGGRPGGGNAEAAPVDPAQAQLRLQFLQSIQGQVTDERVARSLAFAQEGLMAQASGQPAPNPRELLREMFQGGGRGNRAGGGAQNR